MAGKIVNRFSINMIRDYLVIPTNILTPGNYIVKLILNGSEAGTQKIIIK